MALGHIGDGAQLCRGGDPAPDARHHGVAAVLLDIGVQALVDEARGGAVFGLHRPGAEQVIVERRATARTAIGAVPLQFAHHRLHRGQLALADRRAHLIVGVLGAATQGPGVTGTARLAAHSRGEDLLDQAGAAAAGGRGLGVSAHLFQGEQALGTDCLHDVALAHPVAAAHLGAIGHRRQRRVTTVARIAHMGLTEQQLVAKGRDIGTVAHQLEVPGTVQGIAVEHRALDAVVLEHHLFVHADAGVAIDDGLGLRVITVIPGGEDIDPADLELGRGHRALIAAIAQPGEVVGADLALFEQRRDQAVGLATVLCALAHRVDARVEGLHGIADHDAAFAVDPGLGGKGGVRADPGRHHHQIGSDLAPVLQHQPLHALLANERLGAGTHQEFDAAPLQLLLQQRPGGGVELTLHQGLGQVHHPHRHAALAQADRRLQPEQAAADHHCLTVVVRHRQHLLHVGDVAKTQHAGQFMAGHRQDKGTRAGGDQQAVVGDTSPVGQCHLTPGAVDPCRLAARDQFDAVLGIPLGSVEQGLIKGHLAAEYRREHDAVVVAMGLGTDHGDRIEAVVQLQQLLDGAHTGHAVADQYQFFFHQNLSCLRVKRISSRSDTFSPSPACGRGPG